MKSGYLILISLVFVFSCSKHGDLKDYLTKCNQRTSPLWTEFSSDRYKTLTQYKPALLNVLTETGKMDLEDQELDSFINIYSDFTTYRLFLSDYFVFSSGEVLEGKSVSPELQLESYLQQHLIMVEGLDTIERPNIHINRSREPEYPMIANLVFVHPDTGNFGTRTLLLKSANPVQPLAVLSRIEFKSISDYIK